METKVLKFKITGEIIPMELTAEGFFEVQKETLTQQIQVYPARSWAPSQIGHPCDRFLVYRFTRWEEQAPYGWVLQSIFNEGNLHAPDVYARIERMGFEVVREQDRPRQWVVGGAKISGRIDGKVMGFRGQRYPAPFILEIKSMQDYAWQRIETFDDLVRADSSYIRAYADQGYSYLLLEDQGAGVFVLKNKSTGLLKVLPYEMDFARGEWMLQRIERLEKVVQAGGDVDPISYDAGICDRCPFNHVCWPARDMGKGMQLLEDAQLLDDITEAQRLKSMKSEYEALDKSIKARLKNLGTFEAAAIGPFVIVRKEVPVKAFNVAARTDIRFEIKDNSPKTIAQVVKEIEG